MRILHVGAARLRVVLGTDDRRMQALDTEHPGRAISLCLS